MKKWMTAILVVGFVVAFSTLLASSVNAKNTTKGKPINSPNLKTTVIVDYARGGVHPGLPTDVVVVVGAKLTPQDTVRERPNTFDPRRQKIIQIDIDDRNAGWTFPVELGLIGDAGSILTQLVEASSQAASSTSSNRQQWTDSIPGKKQDSGFFDDPEMHRDSSPVKPQRLVAQLQECLDPSTVFALDAGNNRPWMAHFYKSRQANTFFCPGGTAGMGWALPAAVGLKLVYPDRPVVAVTGDGGYMMVVNALSTAVQYDLPILSKCIDGRKIDSVEHVPLGDRVRAHILKHHTRSNRYRLLKRVFAKQITRETRTTGQDHFEFTIVRCTQDIG